MGNLVAPTTTNSSIQFEDLDEFENQEPSTWARFSHKFKEQPLVPIGAAATTIALCGAGRAIQQGRAQQFNLWLRYRVIFQGLTVIAALGGSLYYSKEQEKSRAAQEEERIRRRDERIQQQEESASRPAHNFRLAGQVPGEQSMANENPEARRALMKRKIAEQARLDGIALRGPSGSRPADPAH